MTERIEKASAVSAEKDKSETQDGFRQARHRGRPGRERTRMYVTDPDDEDNAAA